MPHDMSLLWLTLGALLCASHQAIAEYTKAIELLDTVSTYWANRADAFAGLKRYVFLRNILIQD